MTALPSHIKKYALVVIDRAYGLADRELTYDIPQELQASLTIGCAVRAPLARRHVVGYVVGFATTIDFDPRQLRMIEGTAAHAPIFDDNALRLARWMSAYYHVALAECLACCMPQGWQTAMERKYSLTNDGGLSASSTIIATESTEQKRQRQVTQLLHQAAGPLSLKELKKRLEPAMPDRALSTALAALVEQGKVEERESLPTPDLKPRRVLAAVLRQGFALDEAAWQKLENGAPKQAKALRCLLQTAEREPQPCAKLSHDFGVDSPTLRALEKKGWVDIVVIEQARSPMKELPPPDKQLVNLTAEQTAAVAGITAALNRTLVDAGPAEICLLQGVTASGKTEVYLRAIEKCLQLGKRALVLVPEIALTAQTVEIFQRRFQERVAIMHSALSSGERFDEWRRARAGRADIIVGARSAVFAPCRSLGLIIIDEEHDHSYKQDSMPRYHARDVALKRAAIEGAVLVLGSATPALESYHRAMRGEYSHLLLTKRVADRNMPVVEIVDMTDEAKAGSVPVLSTRLQNELCETVKRGEQAIIFLNRRGFATYVQCIGCGYVARCEHCDVSLTFHRGAGELRCHHCGNTQQAPEACPQCDDSMLGFSGTGTEKVESEVAALLARRGLSDVNILRLDRDTTLRKGAHGKILGEFRQGKAQILIGTQMVTKGLDFPNVTLVGVISADTALNVPDFRAAERTFQLLAQVAGRAGRGERPGKVLIQALATDHYAIEAARMQHYEAFVQQEIELRQSPAYPPFSHIVNIVSTDEDIQVARNRIEVLALKLHEVIESEGSAQSGGCELLGPVECPIARVKGKYRYHLMLRDRNRPRLHRILGVYDALSRKEKEGLTVDVDAMTIL